MLVLRIGSRDYVAGNRNRVQEIESVLGVRPGVGARSWNMSKRAGARCR